MSSRRIETCPHKGGLADLLYVVVERRSIHRKAMSGGLVANHGKYTSLSNAVIRYQRADATYKFDNQALGRGKDFCIGSALSPFTPSEAANEIVLVYLRRLHRCERIQRVQGGYEKRAITRDRRRCGEAGGRPPRCRNGSEAERQDRTTFEHDDLLCRGSPDGGIPPRPRCMIRMG